MSRDGSRQRRMFGVHRLIAPGALAALVLFCPYRAIAHRCTGDCNGDDRVTVSELVVGLSVALAEATLSACPEFDADRDDAVSINELRVAVNNAFTYCGHLAPPPAE